MIAYRPLIRSITYLGIFLLASTACQAMTTVEFVASADTQIVENRPDTVFGEHHSLAVTNFSPYKSRALFRFDLSSIPADQDILSATLRLRLGAWGWGVPLKVTAHEVLIPWDETATWNTFGNSPGSGGVAGSDYQAEPASVRTFTAGQGANNTGMVVDFHLADLVRQWYQDPSSNLGVYLTDALLDSGDTPDSIKYFLSRESWMGTSVYPRLVVTYTNMSGLEYSHHVDPSMPWSIHVLKIDRSQTDLAFSANVARGRINNPDWSLTFEPVSSQAMSISSETRTPVAAINGDFYSMSGTYQGKMSNMHIREGELVSRPQAARGNFWIDPNGNPQIGRVTGTFTITWPNGATRSFQLNGNRGTGASLFTPTFGPATPSDEGREIVLEAIPGYDWLPLRPDQTYQARVRSIHESCGRTLSPDVMIISLAPDILGVTPEVFPGDTVQISTSFTRTLADNSAIPLDLSEVQTAIGGNQLLVRDGQNVGAVTALAPRTSIGFNETHIFFMVVDGRQDHLSIGMSLHEVGQFMADLGCTDALNLDGGGSSTFWFFGQVKNSPSDGAERWVANALILYRKIATNLSRINDETDDPGVSAFGQYSEN